MKTQRFEVEVIEGFQEQELINRCLRRADLVGNKLVLCLSSQNTIDKIANKEIKLSVAGVQLALGEQNYVTAAVDDEFEIAGYDYSGAELYTVHDCESNGDAWVYCFQVIWGVIECGFCGLEPKRVTMRAVKNAVCGYLKLESGLDREEAEEFVDNVFGWHNAKREIFESVSKIAETETCACNECKCKHGECDRTPPREEMN